MKVALCCSGKISIVASEEDDKVHTHIYFMYVCMYEVCMCFVSPCVRRRLSKAFQNGFLSAYSVYVCELC